MSNNTKEPVQEEQDEQDLSELLRIRREKLAALQQEGKDPFQITVCKRTAFAQEIRDRFDELENKDVTIAGRIMSWRHMGKASFLDLYDRTGRIQVYLKIDQVGEDVYRDLANWDIGDIAAVSGYVFRTRRGFKSLRARLIYLLLINSANSLLLFLHSYFFSAKLFIFCYAAFYSGFQNRMTLK